MTTARALETFRAGYNAQLAGDLVRAEQLYRQGLALDPDSADALLLLGVLCERSSRPAEAIQYLRRALDIGGDSADAHASLGRAYANVKDFQRAIGHLQRASEMNPRAVATLVDLGNAFSAAERHPESIASYEAALKIEPNSAEIWANLASSHNDARNPDKGLRAIDCALHLNPDLAPAWTVKADLLAAYGQPAEAIDWYRKYLARHPDDVATLRNLANAQRDADDPQAGIATLQQVLDRDPHDPHALFIMGRFREQLGELDGATECYRAAIRVAPRMAPAYYQLAQLRGRRSSDDELAAMLSAWDSRDLSTNDRIQFAFGLYRALEQRSRYDEAFDYLEQANRLNAGEVTYDDGEVADWMNAAVAGTEAAIARLGRDAGEPDPRPVFVLGMLRSGTTLTEQILASHSQVAGAGELSYVRDMMQVLRGMTGPHFPGSVEQLLRGAAPGAGYVTTCHATPTPTCGIATWWTRRPRITRTSGFWRLPCRRRDSSTATVTRRDCFAIYRMPLRLRHTYAHDLTALGRYYVRYWHLMQALARAVPRSHPRRPLRRHGRRRRAPEPSHARFPRAALRRERVALLRNGAPGEDSKRDPGPATHLQGLARLLEELRTVPRSAHREPAACPAGHRIGFRPETWIRLVWRKIIGAWHLIISRAAPAAGSCRRSIFGNSSRNSMYFGFL